MSRRRAESRGPAKTATDAPGPASAAGSTGPAVPAGRPHPGDGHAGSWLGRYLKRTLIVASIVAVLLIAAIILLDFFGDQPQPFQYLLH